MGLSISRDGRSFLYSRAQYWSNLWLWTGDRSGKDPVSGPKQLTAGTFLISGPSLSPDGRRVAFSRGDGTTSNIFVMDLTDNSTQQLTFFNSPNMEPAWSPDGRSLAFWSTEGGTPKVWRVGTDGGPPRAFEHSRASPDNASIAWAPGSKILYPIPGSRNMQVLDPVTERENLLVPNDSVGWMFRPVASPDGKGVIVTWNRMPTMVPWMVSLADGSQRSLETPIWPIAWSNNGGSLYALDSHVRSTKAIRIDAEGRETEVLADIPATWEVQDASISADGRIIVWSVTESRSDIWSVENFDPDAR